MCLAREGDHPYRIAWLAHDRRDDNVLRDWPRGRAATVACTSRACTSCADADELDRARAEGRKALAIARTTRSSVAARELKQLTTTLNA